MKSGSAPVFRMAVTRLFTQLPTFGVQSPIQSAPPLSAIFLKSSTALGSLAEDLRLQEGRRVRVGPIVGADEGVFAVLPGRQGGPVTSAGLTGDGAGGAAAAGGAAGGVRAADVGAGTAAALAGGATGLTHPAADAGHRRGRAPEGDCSS